MGWQQDFITQGYTLFPRMVPQELIAAAREAITTDLRKNYDPARFEEYNSISYCPDICASKPIMDLLLASPTWELLDEVLGTGNIIHGRGQIAIRQAHNSSENMLEDYHLDGVPDGKNGLTGQTIHNFTALVGIFLSDIPRPYAGSLIVWPGSHKALEQYFREQGPKAADMGRPDLALGEPVQIIAKAGDVILCHYELAHSVASNTSDMDRVAVYFRISLKDLPQRRWELLTNIWQGWKMEDRADGIKKNGAVERN